MDMKFDIATATGSLRQPILKSGELTNFYPNKNYHVLSKNKMRLVLELSLIKMFLHSGVDPTGDREQMSPESLV